MIEKLSGIADRNWLQGRVLFPLLKRHADATRGTVVDVGCGSSPFQPLFESAALFIRIDQLPADGGIIVADAGALPIRNAVAEVVLLSRMLGDVPDLVGAMKEFARILAPQGKVLIFESMAYPQHDLPHDYWRVMPNGLRWAASEAGLVVHSLDYLGGYFTQLSMHWNIFLLGALERYRVLKPVAAAGRACGNVVFGALDALNPRPHWATDYFAVLIKAKPSHQLEPELA